MGLANVIAPPSKFTKLYSGSKTYSGTINFDDNVANYDALLIKCKSNTQYMTKVVLLPAVSEAYMLEFAIYNAAGLQSEPFYYRNVLKLSISATGTSASLELSYSNNNLQVGIVSVYGIKF